jgi:hypothetical protein
MRRRRDVLALLEENGNALVSVLSGPRRQSELSPGTAARNVMLRFPGEAAMSPSLFSVSADLRALITVRFEGHRRQALMFVIHDRSAAMFKLTDDSDAPGCAV